MPTETSYQQAKNYVKSGRKPNLALNLMTASAMQESVVLLRYSTVTHRLLHVRPKLSARSRKAPTR